MTREEFEQYQPNRPGLLKQAVGVLSSLAMWGVGLGIAHAVLRRGKTGLLKTWAASTKYPSLAAAAKGNLAEFEETGGSLTAVYARLKGPGHQVFSALRYAAEEEPVMVAYTAARKDLNALDRLRVLRGQQAIRIGSEGKEVLLDKAQRRLVYEGMAAKYGREMATVAPLFYAGEQAFGRPDQGVSERDRSRHPAWWNLPGHAVNFARWLPGFVAFDLVARGAFKGIPTAYHAVMARGVKNSSLRHLTLTVDSIRERRAAISKDNPYIQATAAWDSFKDLVGTHRTPSNYISRRQIKAGKGTVVDWAKANLKQFTEKKDTYAAQYVERIQGVLQSSSRYFMGRDLLNMIEPPEGLFPGYKNIFSLIRQTGGMGPSLRKRFAEELFNRSNTAMPALAKYGGLKPLRLRHIKKLGLNKQAKEITQIWKKAEREAGLKISSKKPHLTKTGRLIDRRLPEEQEYQSLFREGKIDKLKPVHTIDDLLMSKDLYWDPQRERIVDLTGTRGYDVIGRTLDMAQRRFSLADRFPVVDIFPVRAFVGYSMPNIAVAGKSIIPVNTRTDALTGNGVNSSVDFIHGPGIFLRDPGKRTYTLYNRPATGGAYEVGATNLYGMNRFDSQKMAKIQEYMEGISSSMTSGIEKTNPGKLRAWLFKNFNIAGGPGTQDHESMFAIASAHFSGHNRAWAILSKTYGLRSIAGDQASIDAFIDSADSNIKLNQLTNVFLQARRAAFKVLGRDDLWKKVMEPILPKDSHGKVQLKGLRKTYKLDDLLKNRPEKDGTIPIFDVLERLYSEKSGPALLPDTANLENIRDLIRYNRPYRASGEPPTLAARRALTEYHIQKALLEKTSSLDLQSTPKSIMDSVRRVLDVNLNTSNLAKTGLITTKEKALVDMAVQGMAWEQTLRNIGHGSGRAYRRPGGVINELFGAREQLSVQQHKEASYIVRFLKRMQTDTVKQPEGSGVSFDRLWDDYRQVMGKWKTLEVSRTGDASKSLMQQALSDNPYFWFKNDAATWGKSLFHYGFDTFGRVMGWIGLGWDRGKYNTILGKDTGVLNLWGRRLALAGGVVAAYQAVDTFTDTNPVFNATFLDEGVTVALADQAVRARMLAGYAYDFTGVTAAMKYMEGLMPKSTKVLPGAAMGFAMGGVPGMIAGGLLNAYVQPQLAESPLAFLSALPPLAPFVADLTKSHQELRDLYSGREWEPIRKGRGWPLGGLPMEGGRISQYRPSWYHLLKSQAAASPVLYGSKIEQFLFKDLPLLDFSIGDVIDPRYLERKHAKDRPYAVPDVPFQEIPLVGPALAATVGRALLAIHPLGKLESPLKDDAVNALTSGGGYSAAGGFGYKMEDGFGPKYAGAFGEQFDTNGDVIYGTHTGRGPVVQSPYSPHQVLAEQIYKGWIEPAGLLGWGTSAALWGGDEPYTSEPVFASAGEMDSFSRRYWDLQLGDPLLITEGFRRLVPRPRTSVETVNPLRNTAPNWLPEEFQYGDPYCLTPTTAVETVAGPIPANKVKAGTLVRTRYGRYFPVSRVSERMVDEPIYMIKLGVTSYGIGVTGEHPFFRVDERTLVRKFIEAKDLKVGDYVTYPLIWDRPEPIVHLIPYPESPSSNKLSVDMPVTAYSAALVALMTKYGQLKGKKFEFVGASAEENEEFKKLLLFVFGPNTTPAFWALPYLQFIINEYGIPYAFYASTINIIGVYLSYFMTADLDKRILYFNLPNRAVAYHVWSILLQNFVLAKLAGTKLECPNWDMGKSDSLQIQNRTLWVFLTGQKESMYSTRVNNFALFRHRDKRKEIYFKITAITKKDYSGPVYGYQVDRDDTFCVAGCVVHNTRIPMGEVLLPGSGYESIADVNIDFPTGASRLGYSAYEQALYMVGLQDPFDKDTEEILDTGTAIHRMVQTNLAREGVITKAEAFIYDPYTRISSYVDGIMKMSNGQELPLEIKTINARGFQKLTKPKHKHIIQLNSYLHMMNAPTGKFIYVNRDDPEQTKTYSIRYSPKLWASTVAELNAAREYASKWLEQGYGNAANGYSYLDRLQVLMNAAPFSTEYREVSQVVGEQSNLGLLSAEDQKRYERVEKWHGNMLRRYELYPYRFKLGQIVEPDNELQQLNSNELIKAASEYGPLARIAGSVWESFTHLRSPIHTKLIGLASPEEQYERSVLYGSSFYDWTQPIDTMIAPWMRGLKSVTNPVQGAISFGMGGGVVAGLPGMLLGAATGLVYGATHGVYQKATGNRYIPRNFQKMEEMQQYFDRLKYDQANYMWMATKDPKYLKQMQTTAVGWTADTWLRSDINRSQRTKQQYRTESTQQGLLQTTFSSLMGAELPVVGDIFEQGVSWSQLSREANNPIDYDLGSDRGFGSPWRGIDHKKDLEYTSTLNIGGGIAAAPYWDRPFFTAFLGAPESNQEKILNMVDADFAEMLKAAWRRGNNTMQSSEEYFKTHYKPSTSNPINLPDTNIDDWKYETVENAGLNAHDFGLGWRSQVRSINNSPIAIQPLDINAKPDGPDFRKDFSIGKVRTSVQTAINRTGFVSATADVSGTPSVKDRILLRVKINRNSSEEIARVYKEGQRHVRV